MGPFSQSSRKKRLVLAARRLLALCLLAILIAASNPVIASPAPFVRGDVNSDGQVSISDLMALVRYVVINGESISCLDSADIDDDGRVTIGDPILLISALFDPQTPAALPMPFPDPGMDPTDDLLGDCQEPLGFPSGSELPHIYFCDGGSGSSGFAAASGQTSVRAPIYIDSELAIQGITVSISYQSDQLENVSLLFDEGVAVDYQADLRISHTLGELSTSTDPTRFVYGYVVMELLTPIEQIDIPAGEALLLGHLQFDVSQNLNEGDVLVLRFESIPESFGLAGIGNELAIAESPALEPEGTSLHVPVVHRDDLFLRGDVDRDSDVDFADAISLVQWICAGVGDAPSCLDAVDANDDGFVDVADAISLFHAVFGLGTSESSPIAAPYPYEGVDPTTSDSFECVVQTHP